MTGPYSGSHEWGEYVPRSNINSNGRRDTRDSNGRRHYNAVATHIQGAIGWIIDPQYRHARSWIEREGNEAQREDQKR